MSILCSVYESAIWAGFSGMARLGFTWHHLGCSMEAEISTSKWFTDMPGKLAMAAS